MSGRKPVNRDPVRAFVLENPSRGLTVAEISSATGVSHRATDYVLCHLCNTGEIAKLRRGMIRIFFGSEEYADSYDMVNPYRPKERKKHGYGKTPERRQEILKYMRQHPGKSASVVALGIGVAKETVRLILVDMRRDGEAFACGTQKRPHWYASREAMEADQASVKAAEEARKAAISSHKARAGRVCAGTRGGQARAAQFFIAAKAAIDKSVAERIKAAKAPPKIIGMESAKITICRPCDVERFRVVGPVAGGWSTMGVGRYLEDSA